MAVLFEPGPVQFAVGANTSTPDMKFPQLCRHFDRLKCRRWTGQVATRLPVPLSYVVPGQRGMPTWERVSDMPAGEPAAYLNAEVVIEMLRRPVRFLGIPLHPLTMNDTIAVARWAMRNRHHVQHV